MPSLLHRIGRALNARPVLVVLLAWTVFATIVVWAIPPRNIGADLFALTGSRFLATYWWFLATGMLALAMLYGMIAAALHPMLGGWSKTGWLVAFWFTGGIAAFLYCPLMWLRRDTLRHEAMPGAPGPRLD